MIELIITNNLKPNFINKISIFSNLGNYINL